MQATDILIDEHRVIEQVLSCLERIAADAETGCLDYDAALETLDFLSNFADRCHHGKEERYLFPLMEAKGFLRRGGPTGVMLHEHHEGRRHVRVMYAALEQADAGSGPAVRDFVRHAQEYVVLLRQHIAKENQCLFPMANRALDGEDQRRLLDAFVRVEDDGLEPGAHEHFLETAHRLAKRYGVEKAGCHNEQTKVQLGG
jgi:hemerythrin-like domain-containing protein